jgi:PEP-CTERM motif
MKTLKVTHLVAALGLSVLLSMQAHAGQIFVTNNDTFTIGEYTTSGATVNASLISGLNGPTFIAVVPEPSTYALMIAGLGLVGFVARRRTMA